MASLLTRKIVPALPGCGYAGGVTPNIVGGQITSYTVSASGNWYVNPPQMVVTGSGVGATVGTVTTNASGGIASVAVGNPGSGYTAAQVIIVPQLSIAQHSAFQAPATGILTAIVHSITFCNYDATGQVHPIWVQLVDSTGAYVGRLGEATPVTYGTTLTSKDFTINMAPGDYLLIASDEPNVVSATINYVQKS